MLRSEYSSVAVLYINNYYAYIQTTEYGLEYKPYEKYSQHEIILEALERFTDCLLGVIRDY